MHVRYVCMYICTYVRMLHVCNKSVTRPPRLLPTTAIVVADHLKGGVCVFEAGKARQRKPHPSCVAPINAELLHGIACFSETCRMMHTGYGNPMSSWEQARSRSTYVSGRQQQQKRHGSLHSPPPREMTRRWFVFCHKAQVPPSVNETLLFALPGRTWHKIRGGGTLMGEGGRRGGGIRKLGGGGRGMRRGIWYGRAGLGCPANVKLRYYRHSHSSRLRIVVQRAWPCAPLSLTVFPTKRLSENLFLSSRGLPSSWGGGEGHVFPKP